MKAPDIPGSVIIHSQGVPTGRNPTLRDIVHCSTLTDVSQLTGGRLSQHRKGFFVSTKNYSVEGMTCEHCVTSVQEEVAEVVGTQGVEVELESGRVTVTGEGFSDDAIIAAVERAGYTLKQDS